MLARLKTRGLVRDTAYLSLGQGLRLVIQAAYFVLLARSLGPDRYGAFVTVVAMAALAGPFSGVGTANLFIKNVRAGKREAAICWGNGIAATMLSGSVLTGVVAAMSGGLHLRTAPFVVVMVCFADLVFLKVTELAAAGFTALDDMTQTSVQSVVVSLLRLAGIAGLIATARPLTLERWVVVYWLTSGLGTIYAVSRGSRLWGRPVMHWAALREDAAEGVYFSIAGSATTIYNDIDKIMLSRLASLEATGVYAAAYRVIDVSMTPVRALAAAAYPHFFRRGVEGIGATRSYALSLIAKAVLYGSAASVGLLLFAPVLPHLLGPQYRAVVPAVRWLALIPSLRCLHSFMADALSGANRQRTRTSIQVGVAVINIGLNLMILPRYTWRGAAWTSVGSDGLLVVLFWSAVFFYHRRQSCGPLLASVSRHRFHNGTGGCRMAHHDLTGVEIDDPGDGSECYTRGV